MRSPSSTSVPNPLEIWKRRFSSSSRSSEGYGSIASSSGDDEDDCHHGHHARRSVDEANVLLDGPVPTTPSIQHHQDFHLRRPMIVVASLSVAVVASTTMGVYFAAKESSIYQNQPFSSQHPPPPAVRPHFTPTLLQVIDTTLTPTGNYQYVNALNSTLYNEMLHPTTRYIEVIDLSDASESDSDVGQVLLNNELPQLFLDKTTLDMKDMVTDTKQDATLTLTWTVGRDTTTGQIMLKEDDVIALYCGKASSQNDNDEENNEKIRIADKNEDAADDEEGRSFLEAATVAQARVTSRQHGGQESDSWYLPSFPILRQHVCHFRLYTRLYVNRDDKKNNVTALTLVKLASSDPITILHANVIPSAVHLALHQDPSKMVVQFTTGEFDDDEEESSSKAKYQSHIVPVVRYAVATSKNHNMNRMSKEKKSSTSTSMFKIAHGTTDTYTADDLCQYPANKTEAGKFYPPGSLHTVTLTGLDPSTEYQYQVGLAKKKALGGALEDCDDEFVVWSDLYRFRSAPVTQSYQDSQKPFSYVVYGDQGCPDGQHCKNGQRWIRKIMEHGSNDERPLSVHHFGDISYANGAAHIWDEWFRMISPISTTIPIMVSIGNHEYDHTDGGIGKDLSGVTTADGYRPAWGDMMQDSKGECGVPMAKRFKMPTSNLSNGVFWYSYDFANVHTVVISSEHDVSPGSPQFDFLLHDLKNVDRYITPWLVLETHRPLYEGENGDQWMSNKRVGEAMRLAIEDLLFDYDVDIVLGGHYHEYHRTCDRLYNGECDASRGPIHITIGAAGAPLDNFYDATYDQKWTSRYLRGVFGYGKMNVVNDTALRFEFISYNNNEMLDEVWILRDRKE